MFVSSVLELKHVACSCRERGNVQGQKSQSGFFYFTLVLIGNFKDHTATETRIPLSSAQIIYLEQQPEMTPHLHHVVNDQKHEGFKRKSEWSMNEYLNMFFVTLMKICISHLMNSFLLSTKD